MEKIKVFDSGLKLIVKKMSGIYTACCGVFVGVGSSVENTSTKGFSHFIEHLLFKGTKKRSALEISEEIDNVGGQLNAYTSKDVTCFYTRTMSEHTEKCMELLSDMFFDAQFDVEEIERENKIINDLLSLVKMDKTVQGLNIRQININELLTFNNSDTQLLSMRGVK